MQHLLSRMHVYIVCNDWHWYTNVFCFMFSPVILSYCWHENTNAASLLAVTVKKRRGFGSVVKHSTADPGIASSIPPHSN